MPDKYKIDPEEKGPLLRELNRLLKAGDEREFMRVLRKYGKKDEDPEFSALLKLFRELMGRRP